MSGCKDKTVKKIVRGDFKFAGENHGRCNSIRPKSCAINGATFCQLNRCIRAAKCRTCVAIGRFLRHRPYYKRDEKFNDLDATASGNPNLNTLSRCNRVISAYSM